MEEKSVIEDLRETKVTSDERLSMEVTDIGYLYRMVAVPESSQQNIQIISLKNLVKVIGDIDKLERNVRGDIHQLRVLINEGLEECDFEELKEEIIAIDRADCLGFIDQRYSNKYSCSLLPTMSIQLTSDMGYNCVANLQPFLSDSNVFDNIKKGGNVTVDFSEEKIEIGDRQVNCDIYETPEKFNTMYSEELEYIYSNYDEDTGWIKLPLADLKYTESDKISLTSESNQISWCFDQPSIWTDDESEIVPLVDNYGYGDPEQLEYVYIRPRSCLNSSEVSTKESECGRWSVALENININTKDSEMSIISTIKSTLGLD